MIDITTVHIGDWLPDDPAVPAEKIPGEPLSPDNNS